uniref:GRIP domain-containing protein n=1 Tax=Panagrolaimus superbus TaxID=310955 RepID=A0A914Y4S5_9BILA
MNATDLGKQCEEQQKQILNYEKKLKDVVRAYKNLEAEKKALEVALEAISSPEAGETSTTKDASESESEEGKIEALKRAITTLTAKNEQLQEQLDKLKQISESANMQKKLKERLKQSEIEREKMLADHGAVLAEMQTRYAKERTHAEQMEKQIADVYKKLQNAEEQNKKMKLLEKEVAEWKHKAEGTPSVRVLREELENVKKAHKQEIETIQQRYNQSGKLDGDKNSRIAALEQRVQELTEEGATTMQEKADLLNAIESLEKNLQFLMKESDSLKKAQRRLSMEVDDKCLSLPKMGSTNFYESSLPTVESQTALSDNETFGSNCNGCESAQKDLSYFKSLIGHLQKKLRTLEGSHDSMKKDHEKITSSLRIRISDLETAQEKSFAQLTAETKRKVVELEEEMQKQRARLLEIIAEKDREIEVTKNSLATLYSQHYSSDPVDPQPQQLKSPISRKGSRKLRQSTESIRSALTYHSEAQDDFEGGSPPRPGPFSRSLSTHANESKNIFYEQEISRKEQEISELRHIIRLSEHKIREIEQASLTKDIQYLQIVETLKEEIRVLESRITLQKSEVNLEYLRNVFVQLLNSNTATSRKHILKAIGAVLKLTQAEMRRVDAWNI